MPINLPNVFWNPSEARFRAGVRIVIFFTLWGGGPALAHWLVGEPLRTGLSLHGGASIYLDLTRLIVVLAAGWLVARYVDQRPFADYGFHISARWWQDLAFGVALGGVLMTAVFLTFWCSGWIAVAGTAQWDAWPFWQGMLTPLILSAVVAIAEELLARGNQTLNLSEGLRPLGRARAVGAAWLLSSFSFGVLHWYNPNGTWVSTSYLVVYGLMLGVGFILTGELAISIGLHFAWNYSQGAIFGFPVSGRVIGDSSLFTTHEQGPDLWTGGQFGPEAGLVALTAAFLGALLIVGWVRWRHGQVGFAYLYRHMWRYESRVIRDS